METKSNQNALGKILTGVILAGAGFLVWRNYKKSKVALETEHEETKEHFTELGLTEEDAVEAIETEEQEEGGNDIALLAFKLATRGGSRYSLPDDFTNVEDALGSTNVIHVRSDKNNLAAELIFQIPNYIEKVEGVVKCGKGVKSVNQNISTLPGCMDYMNALKEHSGKWSKELGVTIVRKLAGFVCIAWVNPDYKPGNGEPEYSTGVIEISQSPEIYESFLDGRSKKDTNRALTALYENYRENGKRLDEEVDRRLHESYTCPGGDFVVTDMFLGIKLIAPQAGVSINGITFEELARIIYDSTVSEFGVTAMNSDKKVQYDHVLYHPLDNINKPGTMTAVYDWGDDDRLKIFDVDL